MELNARDSEENCLQSSRCLDIHHPSSSGQVAQMPANKSLCYKCLSVTDSKIPTSSPSVEQSIGWVPEHHSNSPAEAPYTLGMGQTQEVPSQAERNISIERPMQIDSIEWHPYYMACLLHLLNVSQHSFPVQSMSAFINTHLPCQRRQDPNVRSSSSSGNTTLPFVSHRHYIRRLIITGHDTPSVLTLFSATTG